MNTLLYILIGIYVLFDMILVKRYENKIKELTEENKKLKNTLENAGI